MNEQIITPTMREQSRALAALLRTLTKAQAEPIIEQYFQALHENINAVATDAIAKHDESTALELAQGFFTSQRPRLRSEFARMRADLRRLPLLGDALRELDALDEAWNTQPDAQPATAWLLASWIVDHSGLFFAATSAHPDAPAYVLQMLDHIGSEPSASN